MRIHTNAIDYLMIIGAAQGIAPGVSVTISSHRSRTHRAAFEVSLEGNGHRGNSGSYGARDASQPMAATWDEWGVLIGRLYVIDPLAVWGTVKAPIYQSAEHFHWSTCSRFAPHWNGRDLEPINLPADTHKRHSWSNSFPVVTGTYQVAECKGSKGKPCSATKRCVGYGYSFDEISGQAGHTKGLVCG